MRLRFSHDRTAGSGRSSTHVRRPAVAGSFYPADPGELALIVDRLLAQASAALIDSTRSPVPARAPKAIVVPHAGYAYSGAVAAVAYALVASTTSRVRRVAILGPAHFAWLEGAAIPVVDAWSTPLGEIPLDDELRLVALDAGARADDRPHAHEHALEVQLPFLQRIGETDLRVLPVAVGAGGTSGGSAEAGHLLGALAEAVDLVVVSTDLSHYHDVETARRLDGRTVDAILARDPDRIRDEAACGVHALRGALSWARRNDLAVRLLDQRTSADTSGGTAEVVGYAAVAIG